MLVLVDILVAVVLIVGVIAWIARTFAGSFEFVGLIGRGRRDSFLGGFFLLWDSFYSSHGLGRLCQP